MLNLVALQIDRDGKKGREDGERGGEGRLFEGGDYFKHFRKRGRLFEGGDQSRDSHYSRKYGNLK